MLFHILTLLSVFFSFFLITPILMGVKWYPTAVLICISLMMIRSSILSCAYWSPVYLPWRNVLCPFKKIGFCYRAVGVLYIFWILTPKHCFQFLTFMVHYIQWRSIPQIKTTPQAQGSLSQSGSSDSAALRVHLAPPRRSSSDTPSLWV